MAVEGIFFELSIIIIVAVAAAAVVKILRQPLLIGYIVTGILVGSSFLNLTRSFETIEIFSQLGITFLLFIVGLNLNPRVIKEVGKVSLVTGIGQVAFTSILGFGIAQALGFSTSTSLYVSLAFTFSSTIIIAKLLSDKKDLDTLYGKISIGFLIVQDFVAIIILMAVSSYSNQTPFLQQILPVFLKGILLIAGLFFIGIYILPPFTRKIASSNEFLLLFSVGWCFGIASLFQYFGFSMEMGALLAGIALSLSPYRYEIASKMSPLRDFFVILFFIWLGSQMILSDLSAYLIPLIVFSLFILIGNPFVVMVIMGLMGYTKRNSFLCGLTVAQISEFSFILIALGVGLGHIPPEILSFAIAVGMITIAGSTYFIKYNEQLYHLLAKPLSIFERKGKKIDHLSPNSKNDYQIILFGYNRIGFSLLKSFKKSGKKYLIIDYNPAVISDLAARGINCMYGDAHDIALLDELNLDNLELVVSTIPAKHVNLGILGRLRRKKIPFIATSHSIDDSFDLYRAGAAYVIMPHFLGGDHISHLLEKYNFDTKKLFDEGKHHVRDLNERTLEGHTHPKKDDFGE
ncbi:hypothetical protein AUJ84_02525 [Candidatus Pacearchaeota archaeon CG1_02_32_132]|nr:MAG: hypothetical protein AUJ84_02525 [Candidatus Pacearchaeota archaeon CG1_02_32_132]